MASDSATPIERIRAACRVGSLEQINEVIEEGKCIDFNIPDACGNTALHLAAKACSLDCVQYLLRKEMNPNQQNLLEKNTPLHEATRNVLNPEISKEIVVALLEGGANPNIRNKEGLKPLDLLSSHDSSLANTRNCLINAAAALTMDLETESAASDDEAASSE